MITVTKEYRFEAAHRLTNYVGECSNIHGHSYRVQIRLKRGTQFEIGKRSCPQLDEQGMVVDFKKIKELIGKWIMQHLDHALILDKNDGILINGFNPEQHGLKVYYIHGSPTAERIALRIMSVLESATFEDDVFPVWVRVWETDTAYAEVEATDAH